MMIERWLRTLHIVVTLVVAILTGAVGVFSLPVSGQGGVGDFVATLLQPILGEDEMLEEVVDVAAPEYDGAFSAAGNEPGESVIGVAVSEGPTSTTTSETPEPTPTRPTPTPTTAPASFPTPTSTPTTPAAAEPRFADAVLRWLPEIRAASEASGAPAELLAAVVQVQSGGDPGVVGPSGGRGLTGVDPADLTAMGVAEVEWHDSATNLRAAADVLTSLRSATGSWDEAVGRYLDSACGSDSDCVDLYSSVVFLWRNYYAGVIVDPAGAGFAALPRNWSPPPVEIQQLQGLLPIRVPPGATLPTPVPSATPTATATTAPTVSPTVTSEAGDEATPVP